MQSDHDPLVGMTGFLREADLLSRPAVTPEQAAANRLSGKGPKRPRAARKGLVPWSSATHWRRVKSGDFPAPVKLSERVTAWPVEAVREWMKSKVAG